VLKTVAGDTLTVSSGGDVFSVADQKGAVAQVTIPDVIQSNAVILVIDKVLLPGCRHRNHDDVSRGGIARHRLTTGCRSRIRRSVFRTHGAARR
jgi:hypothetical protein